jgi:hypothetical protein
LYYKYSKKHLIDSKVIGSLIISPPVYSELITQFASRFSEKRAGIEMEYFLQQTGIDYKPFSKRALEIAGIGWMRYVKRRGKEKVRCPLCGEFNALSCVSCNSRIVWRNHVITDFLIGGHAQDLADRLLTRDKGFYKGYFPSLEIVR